MTVKLAWEKNAVKTTEKKNERKKNEGIKCRNVFILRQTIT